MKIKISQAADLLTTALKAKLVPMLHGSPAVGKSSVVKEIAQHFNLKLIDLRLSQCDPCDLLGLPTFTNGRAGYAPMNTFPIEGDEIPHGYSGFLLFLDEFNSAPLSVQAAAYKLVLDRMVGIHHLHKNVAIVCAGNLETDGAIVQPMSTALQSRLIHLEVEVNNKEWVDWANSKGFDHRITSYIDFRPDQIYTFSPDHTDKTYASPRTWEFMNKILKVTKITRDVLPLMIGTVGEGTAREFYGFCEIQDRLPKLEDIITKPSTITVPDEPSVLFALSGSLAANATDDNVDKLITFIGRMPAEFQVVCLRNLVRRNKALLKNPAIIGWITKASVDLF